MLKKFVKKIGKGIKKVGKAIGKPFKKLMKTKLGKIVGTVGMMLMGGWMLSGAKAFTSTLWAGQGMGAAFNAGITQMGTAANATFSTITDGITGMFTQNGTQTVAQGADNLAKATSGGSTTITTGTATDVAAKTAETVSSTTGVSPTDVAGQATATTTDGSIVTAGTETGGGRLLEETSRVGNISKPPKTSLLEPQGVDFATDLSTELTPDLTLTDPKLPPLETKQPGFIERNFPRVADILDESKTFTEAYDKTLGYAPLQNTNLPKFVRNTTIGEGMTVASLMASPADPYVQGSSDVSGAISALSANEERLYGQMPMDQLMTQTSVPSPSPITATSLLRKYRQAGHIYDTTLLAT
tara:strand:- start:6424 stop:7491 length:1068 start_codon:yes stop_codon:yes gene_type:complete